MSSWFNIDPNKIKQLAASTLINAQKHIGWKEFLFCFCLFFKLLFILDKVLDIKEGAPGTEQQPIGKMNFINMKKKIK